MPTSFPVAASNIKKWDGSAWVAYGSTYTPKDFDFFRNINDNEGYYWFGGQWTVMSTDMSTTYFTLNQGTGKWEIKSSVNLPGNPTTTTAGANDNSTKIATTAWVNTNCGADKDMTKLTSVGKNISNWSSNVTNCITEIPQDLKIELSSGTFTLKAGSKVYVPNGNGVFNTVVTSSDLSINPSGFSTSSNRMVIYNPNGTIGMLDVYLPYVYSETTAPTTFDGNGRAFWYDTTNNIIKKTNDSGSTWTGGYGFPIALVHITNGVGIDEIEQLFNGIGFIGRTLYVLPGVKALHSNGFNSDGTLKNDITTVSSVLTHPGGTSDKLAQIILNRNGASCQFTTSVTLWKYDSVRNIFYYLSNNDTGWINIGTYYYDTTEKYITQFNPKLAFHAVDYSDIYTKKELYTQSETNTAINTAISSLLSSLYPVNSIYIGTQSTCPLATLIPGSTWTAVQGRYLLASGTLAGTSETYSATNTVASGLPEIAGIFTTSGTNQSGSGAFSYSSPGSARGWDGLGATNGSWDFKGSSSNSVYNQSDAVRAPGYVVNVWRRVS